MAVLVISHRAFKASEKLPFTTVLLTTTCITPMLRTDPAPELSDPAPSTLVVVEFLAFLMRALEYGMIIFVSKLLALKTLHLTSKGKCQGQNIKTHACIETHICQADR
jgi:hypothetical protein